MGYWPTDAGHTHVLHSLYHDALTLGVTITSPAAGEVVTVDDPTITWGINSGNESLHQLIIYDSEGTLVYDSLLTSVTDLSQQVTAGLLHTARTGYLIHLLSQNDEGLIGVATSRFDTLFPPSIGVTGTRVTVYGDKCFGLRFPELPEIRVRWDQVVPGEGEEFQRYEVLRRPVGEAAWSVIRQITSIETVEFRDYTVQSYQDYEYAIRWVALTGGEIFVSVPDGTPPRARVEFDWTFIHDVLDPSIWCAFYSLDSNEDRKGDREFDRLWGRHAMTLFVGEDDHVELRITGLPDVYNEGNDIWDSAEEMWTRQRTAGSTVCVRRGIQRRLQFCGFSDLSRRNGQAQYEPSATLIETDFDESLLVSE